MSEVPLTQTRVVVPFAIATLIWGSTWFVIHDQLGVVPPGWSVTWRFVVASLAMFIYASATRSPLRIGRQGQAFAAAFGFFQFVLNFNFVYRAEAQITSGLVAVVFALLIVPNSLLGRIFLKQPLARRFLAGSVVALVGVSLLIIKEARADPAGPAATWLGLVLTLAGVISASAANVMQGTTRAKALPMASMLAWGMSWGVLINVLFAWFTTGPPVIEARAGYLLGVIYLGLFASAVAFTCYFSVIRSIGPARAAYSSVITPALAMILSTLLEGYRWTVLSAVGASLTFAGLLIALSARKPAV